MDRRKGGESRRHSQEFHRTVHPRVDSLAEHHRPGASPALSKWVLRHLGRLLRTDLSRSRKVRERAKNGLSQEFLTELKNGMLAPIRERVFAGETHCTEGREDYVNFATAGGGGNLHTTRFGAGGIPSVLRLELRRRSSLYAP